MKKLLLASTALVATAGVASAEVAVTGLAEMGIFDNGNDDTQFFTDIDVTFTMSGEADNGLTFGASVDLDESDGSGSCTIASDGTPTGATLNGTPLVGAGAVAQTCTVSGGSNAFAPGAQGGETMFVSYGGLTLTMGDTDGALDARVGEVALAGSTLADDQTGHGGFDDQDGHVAFGGSGLSFDGTVGDNQVARVDYTFSNYTVSVSAEQVANGASVSGLGDTVWGLGFSYAGTVSGVDLSAGLGWQTIDEFGDTLGLSVIATLANGLSLGVSAGQTNLDNNIVFAGETDDTFQHHGIGIGYEMNALALSINYGVYSFDDEEQSGVGVAAQYDLGGGFTLNAGYGHTDPFGGGDDSDTFSLGARMSF